MLLPTNVHVLVPSNSPMAGFQLPQFRTARGSEALAVLTTSHTPPSPSSSFWSLFCSPLPAQPPTGFWEHGAVRLGGQMSDQELSPCFQTVSQNQGRIWFGKDPSRSHGPTTARSTATSNTGLPSLAQGKTERQLTFTKRSLVGKDSGTRRALFWDILQVTPLEQVF